MAPFIPSRELGESIVLKSQPILSCNSCIYCLFLFFWVGWGGGLVWLGGGDLFDGNTYVGLDSFGSVAVAVVVVAVMEVVLEVGNIGHC